MNSILTDTDKGYIFGLLVGGGNLGPGGLTITLPLKSWGEVNSNPARAGQISSDVLSVVNPLFQAVYGIGVSFSPGRQWVLSCHSLPAELVGDLRDAGFPVSGDLRTHATVSKIESESTPQFKKAFIMGLADSIGSLAASHRRFTDDYQVVSLEFSGFNFELVSGISRLLVGIGCKVDQILWNHPNQHAGEDRYYKSWKKGMKIRVMLGDFGEQAGFGFTSKILGARDNQRLQTNPAATRNVERIVTSAKCLHVDENSALLPELVRGRHFLHWQHIGAAFGAQTVSRVQLEKMFSNALELVTPFTLLSKGSKEEIAESIKNDPFLQDKRFEPDQEINAIEILRAFEAGQKFITIGADSKFDLTRFVEGLLFPVLAQKGETNGRRYKGSLRDQVTIALASRRTEISELTLRRDPRFISPILITVGDFSSLIGPISIKMNTQIFLLNTSTLAVEYDLGEGKNVEW